MGPYIRVQPSLGLRVPTRARLRSLLASSALIFAFLLTGVSSAQFLGVPTSPASHPILDQAIVDLASSGVFPPMGISIESGFLSNAWGYSEWGPNDSKSTVVDVEKFLAEYPNASTLEIQLMIQAVLFHEYKHWEGPDSGVGGVVTPEKKCKHCRIMIQTAQYLCSQIELANEVFGCAGIRELCDLYNSQRAYENENFLDECIQLACSGVSGLMPTCETCELCFP